MLTWKYWTGRSAESNNFDLPPSEDEVLARQKLNPPQPAPRRKTERIEFRNYTVHLTAWPKAKGVLTKEVDALDLLHLGVSRFEPTLRSNPLDPDEEGKWAIKTLQVGAKWYASMRDWLEAKVKERPMTQRERERIFIGWPSKGGVWILRFADGLLPVGFGCYSMCVTMEERCEVLERFGAQYYENAADCFELTPAYIDECRQQRKDLDSLCYWEECPIRGDHVCFVPASKGGHHSG